MASERVRATCKVQVVIEIDAGVWGTTCELVQVHRQAREEAETKIRNARDLLRCSDMRIVDWLPIKTVIVSEER